MVLAGIDEVGRGCWAGPIVAAAVVLKQPIRGLTDSKLLTRRSRARLAMEIHDSAAAIGLGWVEAAEIDRLGLTAAVKQAMQAAVKGLGAQPARLIIDGNYNFLPEYDDAHTLVGADKAIPAVSAASIVAKVARDTYMAEQAGRHPLYGFERHFGYGTAYHRTALLRYGPCELHRRSFKPVKAIP